MTPRRVLIAKPGLDGHDVGARVISLALRDAGFEVIYTGLRRTPEQIACSARDEGVDAVGLSVLSGAHLPLVRAVSQSLAAEGLEEVPLIVGGNIPERDVEALLQAGACSVLSTGTPLDRVVAAFRRACGVEEDTES